MNQQLIADTSLFDAIVIYFLYPILSLAWLIIIIGFVMSLLIQFNVINTYNPFVATVWRIVTTLTEPIYRPIRRVLPLIGGLDFSPLVALLIIEFLRGYVLPTLMRIL
ncbi:YggT family protein [Maricaulis sp. D1M11]|uniref:YggT family protein n=1 Tax=Maricaulis sp. D1M11 TaxID=3076117 RepID=UPI0039B40D0B